MSDPATLRDKVATREIFDGAQLTATDFGAAGDSLAAQLTDKERSSRCRSTRRTG